MQTKQYVSLVTGRTIELAWSTVRIERRPEGFRIIALLALLLALLCSACGAQQTSMAPMVVRPHAAPYEADESERTDSEEQHELFECMSEQGGGYECDWYEYCQRHAATDLDAQNCIGSDDTITVTRPVAVLRRHRATRPVAVQLSAGRFCRNCTVTIAGEIAVVR